jgi:hypothetical protein
MENAAKERHRPEVPLAWLADAPLFIDSDQVSAFYDAVVMPENDTEKITISTKEMNLAKTNIGGKAGFTMGTTELLTTIFPFLSARASVEGGIGKESSSQHERADTIDLRPIKTPHRQLVQLALHYAANLPERVCYLYNGNWQPLLKPSFSEQIPRVLVFLDLNARQPLIPVAAELASGRVVTLFDQLATEMSSSVRTLPPKYPDGDDPEATRAYWQWYSANYNPIAAMKVLEWGIGEGGLPRWVDYRLRMTDGESLHLSVRGRGKYDTGVHAFSTIFRGHEYGLRIVGTLKSGPGLNILAIFEK